MDSITKNSLSTEQIENLVKYNFGSECSNIQSKELTGGMMNAAYKISYDSLESGRLRSHQVILKLSSPASAKLLHYEKEILRTEVRVYQALAGKDLPVPELLKYDFTRELLDCDYFFMSVLDGTEPDFQLGYRSVIPHFSITEDDNRRMELYRLYMDLILAIETYRFPEEYAVPARTHHLEEVKKRLARIQSKVDTRPMPEK